MQAVEEYRKVLQLSSRFTEDKTEIHLTVDKLQLVHTMYNLAEVLLSCPPVQPTLRDDTLREECVQLEKKYMDRYASEVCIYYIVKCFYVWKSRNHVWPAIYVIYNWLINI